MSERTPLPHIARRPEEPPLEGPPKNAEESLLLSIPELARAANTAADFYRLNSEKKRRAIEQLLNGIAQDPQRLENLLDAAAILIESGAYPAAKEIETALRSNINKLRFEQFPPEPRVLERWLTMLAESALYAPIAEAVLKKMVERCQDSPKAIIGFLYNLTLAGATSSNARVMRKALEILSFGHPILPPLSPQGKNFLLASFHIDDEILQKALEIDHCFFLLTKLHAPELLEAKKLNQDKIDQDPDFQKRAALIAKADPQRMQQLFRFYNLPQDNLGIAQFTPRDAENFPITIALKPGTLRNWYNKRIAQELRRQGKQTIALHFPSQQVLYDDTEDAYLPALILSHLQKEGPARQPAEDEPHWATLSHLIPPHLKPHIARLEELNQEICQDINDNTRYLLSPRGDLVEITDPTLKTLGMREILYEMDPRNKRDAIATIRIANASYRIIIDEHLALRHAETLEPLALPSKGAFIQHVLLSHLREIRCSETVSEAVKSPKGSAEAGRKAFTSRRAHLRKLPPEHVPTPEQIRRALETYDIDIVRINREAVARGETVRRTFVFDAENVALSGKGPVRSQTPQATRRMNELIQAQETPQ